MSIPDFDRLFEEPNKVKIAKVRIRSVVVKHALPGKGIYKTVRENGKLVSAYFTLESMQIWSVIDNGQIVWKNGYKYERAA